MTLVLIGWVRKEVHDHKISGVPTYKEMIR